MIGDIGEPIVIGVDLAGGIDTEAISVAVRTLTAHGGVCYRFEPLTAAEIAMRMAEGNSRLDRARDAFSTSLLWPLIDAAYARFVGGPKRKRWDRHGAYYRRQLKKWQKKNEPTVLFKESKR